MVKVRICFRSVLSSACPQNRKCCPTLWTNPNQGHIERADAALTARGRRKLHLLLEFGSSATPVDQNCSQKSQVNVYVWHRSKFPSGFWVSRMTISKEKMNARGKHRVWPQGLNKSLTAGEWGSIFIEASDPCLSSSSWRCRWVVVAQAPRVSSCLQPRKVSWKAARVFLTLLTLTSSHSGFLSFICSSSFLYNFYHYFYMLTNVLFYVSSAINPILYNLVSANFRQIFLSTLTILCLPWRKKKKRLAFTRKSNSISSNHTFSSQVTRETTYWSQRRRRNAIHRGVKTWERPLWLSCMVSKFT